MHAVYAVRERNGRIAVSSADVPGVRRIHKPGRSWTYVPAGRCWQGSKDLGEAPLPVHEREAVRSGPAALQLVGNGQRGLNSTIFGSLRALRLAYDVTAKSPLSRGARPTRYELYVYYGFRVHLIVDVNRHGIATVIKEEQLDARGLVVERERIGIATPAARRLLAPGRSC